MSDLDSCLRKLDSVLWKIILSSKSQSGLQQSLLFRQIFFDILLHLAKSFFLPKKNHPVIRSSLTVKVSHNSDVIPIKAIPYFWSDSPEDFPINLPFTEFVWVCLSNTKSVRQKRTLFAKDIPTPLSRLWCPIYQPNIV